MRAVVNTKKHYVQSSLFAVASGAIVNITMAIAQAVPVAGANVVREGSKISAIYCEMWLTSDDAAAGTAIVTLEKLPGSATVMTAADSAALDTYDNKKNIFHCQMGLTPSNVQYPMASVKGWFRIPKSKQRMGAEDSLVLNIHGQSNGLAACGFFTYKEQY